MRFMEEIGFKPTRSYTVHTEHGEVDVDLPIVLATVLRDHTRILSGVFPGHRIECDAIGREGNTACIGSYQETGAEETE